MIEEQENCPLCTSTSAEFYFKDSVREYLQCPVCSLVFVPPRFHLHPDEERAVYDLHENDPADRGYRHFLSRIVEPMVERLKSGRHSGLDFGCGPGPALAEMFGVYGHHLSLFDKFYHNEPSLLQRQYDFICATEVVEHLHDPGVEFERLFRMLKPDGWFGIMTKCVIDKEAFGNWHYIRDPTHICFYSKKTFSYLAKRHSHDMSVIAADVILFHKPL